MSNLNCGEKFWGCKNYKNSFDKGCSFFKLLDDDVIDERYIKIEKQKKKNIKLKIELENTKKLLRMSLFFWFDMLWDVVDIRDSFNVEKHINLEWILFEVV